MRELQHNAHSVFSMYYHLVLVVKYRRKVIDDNVSVRLQEIFDKIAPKYGLSCEEWNHDADHVHIMFTGQPKSELSKFVNAYKSASQLCHECGYKYKGTKDLSVREWTCPSCHAHVNRDTNAAMNIRDEGRRMLSA